LICQPPHLAGETRVPGACPAIAEPPLDILAHSRLLGTQKVIIRPYDQAGARPHEVVAAVPLHVDAGELTLAQERVLVSANLNRLAGSRVLA
jgi:hypothetical protein